MYKLEFDTGNDRVFVVVPDVKTLFAAWWVVTGYGRQDGCTPHNVMATDLDGNTVDMSQGISVAAGQGSYLRAAIGPRQDDGTRLGGDAR